MLLVVLVVLVVAVAVVLVVRGAPGWVKRKRSPSLSTFTCPIALQRRPFPPPRSFRVKQYDWVVLDVLFILIGRRKDGQERAICIKCARGVGCPVGGGVGLVVVTQRLLGQDGESSSRGSGTQPLRHRPTNRGLYGPGYIYRGL